MPRPSWDAYFMELAQKVAERATCDRKHVGCVIVGAGRHVLSTGYNGSPPGAPHCDDVGHEMVEGHCVRTTHAEINAIAQAARHGVSLNDASAYVTASPCYSCFKALISAGIKRIVFAEFYRDERSLHLANELHISMIHLRWDTPLVVA